MSNKELINKIIKHRDTLLSEYERHQLSIDERLPYLDMIIRLNQEIRTLEELYIY